MKRKPAPVPDPVIPTEIVDQPRRIAMPAKADKPAKCPVCGAECAPNSSENLCWVCRRLKISAWRDTDQQIAASE